MEYRHGHCLVTLEALAGVLRYPKATLRDWFKAAGVSIRKGGLVTLKDAAATFGIGVTYLSLRHCHINFAADNMGGKDL